MDFQFTLAKGKNGRLIAKVTAREIPDQAPPEQFSAALLASVCAQRQLRLTDQPLTSLQPALFDGQSAVCQAAAHVEVIVDSNACSNQ